MNLVVVTVDTLRRDVLGCYGSPGARTTRLDRLAAESVLFSAGRTVAPITLPAHATLFTGLYPASHGARHNGRFLSEGAGTLADLLSRSGYETVGFVASLVLSGAYGISRGFDGYDDGWGGSAGAVMGLHGIWERPGDEVVDSFAQWLRRRDRDTPFFAWVHLYDPHAPYDPPSPLAKVESGAYGGEVIYTDRQVGRVLDLLDERGVSGRTVVVVLSDHGEALGERGESEHGLLLYENTLDIPWMIRVPGGPAGRIVSEPVSLVDFFPTVCDLLDLDPREALPGSSLVPLMNGGEGEKGRPIYAETFYGYYGYSWSPLRAIVSNGWKLVAGTRD